MLAGWRRTWKPGWRPGSTISSATSRASPTTRSRCCALNLKSFRHWPGRPRYTRPRDDDQRADGLHRLLVPLGIPGSHVAGRGREGRPDPAAVSVLLADPEPRGPGGPGPAASLGARPEGARAAGVSGRNRGPRAGDRVGRALPAGPPARPPRGPPAG